MAKVKTKRQENEEQKKVAEKATNFRPWLEDKITTARRVVVPRAARAAKRYGAPAGVAFIVFLISLSLLLPKDHFQQIKERVTENPSDFIPHLLLAEEYLKRNQFEAAKKELLLVNQMQETGFFSEKKERVFGIATFNLNRLWQKKRQSNPTDIKKLIAYWEEVIVNKPNYRDAYLQLALLHYKLYYNEKASEYLQKALALDPNFQPAREIEKKLTE